MSFTSSLTPPIVSELDLENYLEDNLVSLGYQKIQIKSILDLQTNAKTQLEKHNRDQLAKYGKSEFSDVEFDQILRNLKKGNLKDKFEFIRDDCHVSSSDGQSFHIEFLNRVDWCKNIYQFARQVEYRVGSESYRFDTVIFVNGLPLVLIELKKPGVDIKKAFEQSRNYKNNIGDLYGLVQLIIISNGDQTKYLANTDKISYDYSFVWTDQNNLVKHDLGGFSESFLAPCRLGKTLARYMICDKQNVIKVLRPYQIFAVEKIIESVKNNQGGYIWHTTGSGKTLTSFVASTILSRQKDIDQVMFVVDRKDLDSQTVDEFNKFKEDSVDNTDSTKTLVSQLKNPNTNLIVTTIQKLNCVVEKENYSQQVEHLQNKKIIIIFDECHRSQFGKTHKAIKKFFGNSLMYGFTGTPIKDQNSPSDGSTTAGLFGKCLHRYLIIDAIRDKNVLPFSVEYRGNEELYSDYKNQKRIETITKNVLDIHNQKTRRTKTTVYTAMMCVDSVKSLKLYYTEFIKQILESGKSLKIATIFSAGADSDDTQKEKQLEEKLEERFELDQNPTNKAFLADCIKRYNSDFGTNFDINKDFYKYYNDIARRVRSRHIDILLVVNMFLTGFDSKSLNTLYVDKNLKYHGLLQAYSRTNRILDIGKSHGNVVVYRNIKEDTDEAIKLFSYDDNHEETAKSILLDNYDSYIQKVNDGLETIKTSFAPSDIIPEMPEKVQISFIQTFKEIIKNLNIAKSFTDFKSDDVSLSEDEITEYKKEYLNLKRFAETSGDKDMPLASVDFATDLLKNDEIDVLYILSLLDNPEVNKQKIMSIIQADPDLKIKSELFEEYFQNRENESGTVSSDSFKAFASQKRRIKRGELIKTHYIKEKSFDSLAYTINAVSDSRLKPSTITDTLNKQPLPREKNTKIRNIYNSLKHYWGVFVNGIGD